MAVGRRNFTAAFKAQCVAKYDEGMTYAAISEAMDQFGNHPSPVTVKEWCDAAKKKRRVRVGTQESLKDVVALATQRLMQALTTETDTEKIVKAWDTATKRQLEFEKRNVVEVEEEEVGETPEGPGAK